MPDDHPVVQRGLFADFPDDERLVGRAKEFIHTGKIRGRDSALVQEVVRWILAGVSISRVAERFAISRHTVRALMRLAEESGKLAHERERLAQGFVDIAYLAGENFRQALLEGRVPANCLMVAAGIATDKALVLTGQASSIVEHKRAEVDETSAAPWIERLRAMRSSITLDTSPPALPDCAPSAPLATATDLETVGNPAHVPDAQAGSGASAGAHHTLVTSEGGPGDQAELPTTAPAGAASAAVTSATAPGHEQEGGGDRTAAASPGGDGLSRAGNLPQRTSDGGDR